MALLLFVRLRRLSLSGLTLLAACGGGNDGDGDPTPDSNRYRSLRRRRTVGPYGCGRWPPPVVVTGTAGQCPSP
jgi:hypothetical protein